MPGHGGGGHGGGGHGGGGRGGGGHGGGGHGGHGHGGHGHGGHGHGGRGRGGWGGWGGGWGGWGNGYGGWGLYPGLTADAIAQQCAQTIMSSDLCQSDASCQMGVAWALNPSSVQINNSQNISGDAFSRGAAMQNACVQAGQNAV